MSKQQEFPVVEVTAGQVRVRVGSLHDQASPEGAEAGQVDRLIAVRGVGLPLDQSGHADPIVGPARSAVRGDGRHAVTGGLWRRALAEFVGTGLLVAVVVGSAIMAARLSPHDAGLELLENAVATAAGLTALILLFGPVSGAHFNPVVSITDWALDRKTRGGLPGRDLLVYLPVQVAGGIGGTVLANLMFALRAVSASSKDRYSGHLWLGEVVATAGLVALIFGLARSGRARLAPAAVGAYIGAAGWFTSSTSFANPAVTIARALSDTSAGIAPTSVVPFIVAQLAGALIGGALVVVLYPVAADDADILVSHADSAADDQARGVSA
jgi:arsenate reductase